MVFFPCFTSSTFSRVRGRALVAENVEKLIFRGYLKNHYIPLPTDSAITGSFWYELDLTVRRSLPLATFSKFGVPRENHLSSRLSIFSKKLENFRVCKVRFWVWSLCSLRAGCATFQKNIPVCFFRGSDPGITRYRLFGCLFVFF